MPSRARLAVPQPRPSRSGLLRVWHSLAFRNLLYQGLVIGAVIGVAVLMIGNAQEAMSRRGIATGFGFLGDEAGFAIGESLLRYGPSDTYLRAYAVAILNTIKVSVLAVIGATVLGTVLGIARLSANWLVVRTAALYVEVVTAPSASSVRRLPLGS